VRPFAQAELEALQRAFGPFPQQSVELEIGPQSNQFWHPMRSRTDRRGEVVLVLQPGPGQVLVHTKSFYPAGIYRLPTGGIIPSESVTQGLHRETAEETGLDVAVERLLGFIEYRFRRGNEEATFASWAFLLRPLSPGEAHSQDASERITDFRTVPTSELRDIARRLRALPAPWQDWGRFRAVAHDLVATHLGA